MRQPINPDDRNELLLLAILDRPDGDILNIVQSAGEHTGEMYDRLAKAYAEITGTNWGDPNAPIRLLPEVTYDSAEFHAAQNEEWDKEEWQIKEREERRRTQGDPRPRFDDGSDGTN